MLLRLRSFLVSRMLEAVGAQGWGGQRSWFGSPKPIRPQPQLPTCSLSPSSRISSYFRTATWRRQAFWMVRAKPTNLRSRISSRRKSWTRRRAGWSWHLPGEHSFVSSEFPPHPCTFADSHLHTCFYVMDTKFCLLPNDQTQESLPIWSITSALNYNCRFVLLGLSPCSATYHRCGLARNVIT